MTDYTGTDEPTHTDDDALEDLTPVIPIGPGTSGGVAAPIVMPVAGTTDDEDADGELRDDRESRERWGSDPVR